MPLHAASSNAVVDTRTHTPVVRRESGIGQSSQQGWRGFPRDGSRDIYRRVILREPQSTQRQSEVPSAPGARGDKERKSSAKPNETLRWASIWWTPRVLCQRVVSAETNEAAGFPTASKRARVRGDEGGERGSGTAEWASPRGNEPR